MASFNTDSSGGSGGTSGGTGGKGHKYYNNGGEVGKWHDSYPSGGGFGGNGSIPGGVNEININGNPSLDVAGYNYNGATYTDIESLVKAVFDSGNSSDVFYVDFNVNGESSPRTARIRANSAANPGDDLTIDYQYKLSYTVPSTSGASGSTQDVMFYRRDGAQINLPVLSDSVYTNQGGIDYHANKWNVQGQVVSGGNVRVNASGDSTISNITQVPDTSYGFRTSDNALVVNSTGTIAVNVSGRSGSITKIELPSSGSVALDLSSVSNVALSGTLSGSTATPSVTNPQTLASISLPESSFSIGTCAFEECTNLSGRIDLTHCTSLGERAFRRCLKITGVTLGSSITTIPNYAFINCINLTTPIDLSHCTSIGRSAFKYCSKLAGTINLPVCTSLAAGAFQGCTTLTSINLPSCTSIGLEAFLDCTNLTSVVLGSSPVVIDQYVFNGCNSLTNINLENCTSIGQSAFNSCNGLTGTINLSNCTSIGAYAFALCSNITSVNLTSCTTIGNYAFNNCPNLTSVTFGSNITTIGEGAFNDSNATFYFNTGTKSPHMVTYENPNAFKQGVTAIWDDGNGQQYLYKWNRNANGGSGGWDPF